MAEEPTNDGPSIEELQEGNQKLTATVDALRQEVDTWRRKAGELGEKADGLRDAQSKISELEGKLEATSAGVDDEKLNELVEKRAGSTIEKLRSTVDDLSGKLKDYEKKHSKAMTELHATSVLSEAGVLPAAMPDALDKVRRFYEPNGDSLKMRDLEALELPSDVKSLLLTAKGEPVDVAGFAAGFLRKKHAIYFPAESGSGAGGGEKPKASTGKTITQKQFEEMDQPRAEEFLGSGGQISG